MTDLVPAVPIEPRILLLRGQRVVLSTHLADLYGVPTKALNQAVRRNPARFPADFMFELTAEELDALRSQIVTSKTKERRGGVRYLPLAFTQEGVSMLSSVLRSERAALVNVGIMRAFVRFRALLAAHAELAHKLAALEAKVGAHDTAIRSLLADIKKLMHPPDVPHPPRPRIGFRPEREAGGPAGRRKDRMR